MDQQNREVPCSILTNETSRTGYNGPPSEVVPNIPIRKSQNGPFHLISNRNFRDLRLTGKRAISAKHLSLSLIPQRFCV